jgi:WD40 repeat protein
LIQHTLKVWDLESRQELRTLRGHTHPVYAVAVTPDGKQVVCGSADYTLKVWDLASGQELRSLSAHTSGVNSVALTPDGKQAISASSDETVRVWDLERAVIATFTCDASAFSCAFAAERRIVAGDNSGRVHFLSLELPA